MGEPGAPLARRTEPHAAGASAPPREAAPADLAALLARTLGGLAETTGAERVAAWARDESGALRVLAARVEGAQLNAPSEAAFEGLAALTGPTDLGTLPSEPACALAAEHGFSAAAPLRTAEGELLAVLLLGSERDRPGAVRPRVLAALASAATRSLGPAAAAQAAARLARLDLEVQRLDRLAAVGGLLAEIVHEIRNPLVSIKTFLHLLDEEGGESGEFRAVALDELRRIERLLEVVMQHARRPTAPSEESIGELEPALRSVVALATLRATGRGIAVELRLDPEAPPARIAPDALRQVLLNLTLNAIEASERGATVCLVAELREGSVSLAVEDEGPGVPAELRARLFEPFFSTKSRPGGLGLAITRKLVEEAGGSIEIEDRAPRGSRFRVVLPVAE